MKIVVACDSFKNCLTSEKVATSIKKGILKYNSQYTVQTFITSDGGEGSVDAFVKQMDGEYVFVQSEDAYGNEIVAKYGLIENKKTAVIEVAQVIGLKATPIKERKVMQTSSYGVGVLLKDAKNKGVSKIIVCLGGSATNDAGTGILEALGAKFYNRYNEQIYTNSGMLCKICKVDFSKLITFDGIELIVASDVKNKLVGKEGCTYCFGKQKGVHPNKMEVVDSCMQHWADIVKKIVGVDLCEIESGGAAGGIGSALIGLYNAKCESGIDLLAKYCGLHQAIQQADLVITGEGQSDFQTLYGKVPAGIVKIANTYNVPTICISGALGKQYEKLYELGFVGIVSIADRAMSFEQALKCATEKLEQTAYTQIKMIDYFKNNFKKI